MQSCVNRLKKIWIFIKIGYFASAVNVVSSNPCMGLSPRIKISFPVLSICTNELISAPKIIKLFSKLPSVNENSKQESKPIP